jgi:hypothetical protein
MELAKGAIGASEIDNCEPYILGDQESSPLRRIAACGHMPQYEVDIGPDNRRHSIKA